MKLFLLVLLILVGCAGVPNMGTAPDSEEAKVANAKELVEQDKSFAAQQDEQNALIKKHKLFVLQSRLTEVKKLIAKESSSDDEVKKSEVDRLEMEKENIEDAIKEEEKK